MKFIIVAFFSFCVMYANNDTANKESTNIIKGSAYGEKVVNEKSINYEYTPKNNHFEKEAIYNYILLKRKQNDMIYQVKNVNMVSDIAKETQKIENTKNDNNETISVVGYCNIQQDIHVGKQPSSAYVICQTNFGYMTIFGNLIPKNKISTLFFDPQYVEKNNMRYQVEKGSVTTNEARTTYNVATFVNDRKIAEIGYQSTIETANILQSTTHAYLAQLQESEKKTDVDYVTAQNSSSDANVIAIQTSETKKPEWEDYAIGAGIDIVAGVVKTTAEVFKKDLPYLYEIKKNSKIYIDLKVFKKGVKI